MPQWWVIGERRGRKLSCPISRYVVKNVKLNTEPAHGITDLQTTLSLKTKANVTDLRKEVPSEEYPDLNSVSWKMNACFGSTYLTGVFNGVLKSKQRSSVTRKHWNDCITVAITKCMPNYTNQLKSRSVKHRTDFRSIVRINYFPDRTLRILLLHFLLKQSESHDPLNACPTCSSTCGLTKCTAPSLFHRYNDYVNVQQCYKYIAYLN
jgi:hypothetical protein